MSNNIRRMRITVNVAPAAGHAADIERAIPKTVAASARGADGGRVEHLTAPRSAMRCGSSSSFGQQRRPKHDTQRCLERQQHIHHLAAVPRLLHVTDLA